MKVEVDTVETASALLVFKNTLGTVSERKHDNAVRAYRNTLGNVVHGAVGEVRSNVAVHPGIEDLKKFGMIPEFIGRLPIICTLKGLSEEMLVRILKEPRNAILKQYEKLLELDEVKLEFSEEALDAIAAKAIEKDTGARALRAIIEELMLDIMYEIPKDDNIGRVTITKEYIEGTGGPIIDIRSNVASLPERDSMKEITENA